MWEPLFFAILLTLPLIPVLVVRALIELLIWCFRPSGRMKVVFTSVGPSISLCGEPWPHVRAVLGRWVRVAAGWLFFSVAWTAVALSLSELEGIPVPVGIGIAFLAVTCLYMSVLSLLECAWILLRVFFS